jgi:hypothetical protein
MKADHVAKRKMTVAEWLNNIERRCRRLFPNPVMNARQPREFNDS